jgi:carbon-monoxide dehydrogenase medium subunit
MEFHDAHDLDEALAVLAERGPETTVLAGGTDVVVQLLRREIRPASLLHIRRLGELRGISSDGGTVLGALTTHWELMASAAIRFEHRALAEAATTVGGRQTQNVGTVGGNVVNASPAADLMPALLVAGAEVELVASSGRRTLPLGEFVLGRRQTALAPDELLASIRLERPGPRTGEVYVKVGRRSAMEVALVGLAVRLSLAEDGTIADARVALCSVAPAAFRAGEAEAALVGARAGDDAVAEAGRLLEEAARPIDDVRARASYRRRVLAPLLGEAIETCIERTGRR